MTRDAVEEGLNMYFSSLVSNTRDEVSPSRAVSNVSLPGLDNVVKSVSPQINKELRNIERYIDVQVDEFLNYFEGDFDRARFMRTNPVHSNIPSRRAAERSEEDLMDILDNTRNNLQPVYDDDLDDFYAALAENYSEEDAIELLNDTFSQIESLRPYFSRMEITVDLDLGLFSKEVDVTDEVTRAMLTGETDTRREIISGLREYYSQIN